MVLKSDSVSITASTLVCKTSSSWNLLGISDCPEIENLSPGSFTDPIILIFPTSHAMSFRVFSQCCRRNLAMEYLVVTLSMGYTSDVSIGSTSSNPITFRSSEENPFATLKSSGTVIRHTARDAMAQTAPLFVIANPLQMASAHVACCFIIEGGSFFPRNSRGFAPTCRYTIQI